MGSRFSIPAVGKALKSNENTVASYLNFLCDSYICVDVRNFSYSLKETWFFVKFGGTSSIVNK